MSETQGPVRPERDLPAELLDDLTGLPNRTWVMGQLDAQTVSNPGRFSLLFLDLDGLKTTNDRYGHKAGNKLLKDTARILAHSVRGEQEDREADQLGHFVARLSGDEFVILLPGLNKQNDLETVKKRITDNLTLEGIEASIGGRVHDPAEKAEDFLSSVDALMYANKQARKEARIKGLPLRKRAAYRAANLLHKYAGINGTREI